MVYFSNGVSREMTWWTSVAKIKALVKINFLSRQERSVSLAILVS